jgi:hypothetical protein
LSTLLGLYSIPGLSTGPFTEVVPRDKNCP